MTRALRSVMTSAALTLGGLKAAPAVTTGVSLTPGHWFSAVVRTATRHARCGLALALLTCAGLSHALTATLPFTVPAGVTQITVVIRGGAGGGGGTDTAAYGGFGGDSVEYTAVLNVIPGDVFTGTVGFGGGGGGSYVDCFHTSPGSGGGSGAPSGGNGGNAGCSGVSGAGGGGGGSSSLVRGGITLLLAAGAGGGGGGSKGTTSTVNSTGQSNITGRVALANCYSTDNASNGLSAPGDGGGGGGGGGGIYPSASGGANGGFVPSAGGTYGNDGNRDAGGGGAGTSCQSTQAGLFSALSGTSSAGTGGGHDGGQGADGYIQIAYLVTYANLTLQKTWAGFPIAGDVITVTTTGGDNNPTLTSTAMSGGNTNAGAAVSVIGGSTITLPAETFNTGFQANYTTLVSCNNSASPVTNATLPTSFRVTAADSNLVCTYTNTPLPPAASNSGVYVATNNKPASGLVAYDANVLEAYIRNANGGPVGGIAVTFDATGAVAFNGGTVGAAGSCVTSSVAGAGFGTCQVTATSTTVGSQSSAVRIGGGATLGATFSANGNGYTPSPVVYNFVPYVPMVSIVKNVTTGSGTNLFNFSLSGLSAGTDSVAVTGVGSGNGQAALTGTAGLAVTISESSPAGWPVNPVSASCVDTNSVRSGNPSGALGTLNGNVLSIPAVNMVNGANFTCTFTNAFSFTVTGHVFTDNGIGGGTANDGVMNGGESGMGGVGIKLTNCAGGVISTATTDGNGAYLLSVPFSTATGSSLCVEKTTLVPRLSTGASVAGTAVPSSTSVVASDGVSYSYIRTGLEKFSFQWNGTGHYNLNFGDVEPNTFVANGTKSGPAGNSVSYSHSFNAQTGGSVSFSIASAVASPAISGWNEKVFADTACTGSLQAGAALLYPPAVPVTTTAGQIVCVVMQEFIPLSAPLGHTNTAILQASFTFTNASPALSATYSVTDTTTSGKGALDLMKEVRNVTTGGAFSLNNQAKSGETLEYRITYVNNGADPISGLSVTDVTPNHTTFVSASDGVTPAALTSCQKRTPGNPTPAAMVACAAAQTPGGTGSVSLQYVGSVGPGAIGTVLFQVKVD